MRTRHATHPAAVPLVERVAEGGGGGDLTGGPLDGQTNRCSNPRPRRIWVLGAPGGGGGLPREWYTTCLCSFFTLESSKSMFLELLFFDTVITQNDHPRYVKHVLGRT